MVETTTKVGIGASVLVALVLSFFGGVTLFDDNVYYCEGRNRLVAQCDSLSSTGKSCYYQDDEGVKRSKRCTEGWVEIVDDIEIEPEVKTEVISSNRAKNAKQWLCSPSPQDCTSKN